MPEFGKTVNRLICALVAAALLLAAQVQPVSAGAVITVSTTADEFGSGAGCALREAIYAANNDRSFGGCSYSGSLPDTILLPPGDYQLTLPQAALDDVRDGDLDIRSNLTLLGADPSQTRIIAAAGFNDRVIQVFTPVGAAAITVTIRDLTISGGRVTNRLGGGGVLNNARLTLQNVVIDDNHSLENTLVTSAWGGGITNTSTGTLALLAATVSNNESGSLGGGLYNQGKLTVAESLFSGNTAGIGGGGIFNEGTVANVTRTVFDGNTALQEGGGYGGAGIFNAGVLSLSGITVRGSTGAGVMNTAGMRLSGSLVTAGSAAGVVNINIQYPSERLTVENSTLAQNAGAGLTNVGNLLLRHATIADNGGAGLLLDAGTAAELYNNLITRHAAGNCQMVASAAAASNGYNLLDDLSAAENLPCDFFAAEVGDPRLDADLGDYGGPTLAYALSDPSSPAIDRVPADGAFCALVDQRFYGRPAGGGCDAGAFEANSVLLELRIPVISR